MAAPTLPIKNRSTVTPAGGSGRTPKKSGAKAKDGSSRHKAWADFTPTPWLDYAPTPWSNTAGMPPYQSVFGKDGSKRNGAHAEMPGAWPSTPTPKSWGATPTPGATAAVPTNFGITAPPPPMMAAGMPFMPPGFAAMAQMAEAAAAAAGAAAAAAAAAGHHSVDGSPDDAYTHSEAEGSGNNKAYTSDAYDSPPWMQPGMPLPPGPPPMNTLPPQNLPSKGSATHGTGKCRPCAWFWKPHGCHSADDCNYCHLCPEGELKTRKKLKVAAMRMGALTPAKPGSNTNNSGNARTLKLTSLV